jgi:hypothetical protein
VIDTQAILANHFGATAHVGDSKVLDGGEIEWCEK